MSSVVDFAEQIVLSPAQLLAALAKHEQQAAVLALATRRLENSGEWAFDGSISIAAWLRDNARMSNRAAHRLMAKLPAKLRDDPDVQTLCELSSDATDAAVTIVHLIHRRKNYHSQSKDFEFSRFSTEEHWQAGQNDVRRTFRHKAWQHRIKSRTDVTVFDLTRDAQD